MWGLRPSFLVCFASLAIASAAGLIACVGDDPAPVSGSNDAGGTSDATTTPDTGTTPTDSGSADTGSDAGARYCATRVAPPGVTEWFCADFDGPDASEGWTTVESDDGGTLTTTTSIASSPPNALVTQSTQGSSPTFGGGALTWSKSGAKTVQQIKVRADMNPAQLGGVASNYTGNITLVEVGTSDALVSLNYTRGGTLGMPSNATNYTGYYIAAAATGGAAILFNYDLPSPSGQLSRNVWTTIELSFTTTGQAKLTYNGVSVFDQSIVSSTSTQAHVQVGEIASGVVQTPEQMTYDNVEVSVTRAP